MAQLNKQMDRLSLSNQSNQSHQLLNANDKKARKMRKRLSIQNAKGASPLLLDGASKTRPTCDEVFDEISSSSNPNNNSKLFRSFASKSKVGVVPFNPNKVNQDRAMAITSLPNTNKNSCASLFGVFDGHGMHGHDVSSHCLHVMPEWFKTQQNWHKNVNQTLIDCFAFIAQSLKRSDINCSFSGTTAVVVCMDNKNLYTANVGDSRAVLAREEKGQLIAVELSIDQKPDNPIEKARIEKKNGRVEPCKGPMGELIGPHRVWLKTQDMPGLAMSRSFGDEVAASVGVISEPEIIVKERKKNDKFLVIASDGVWEFLSNDDVVDIVSKFDDPKKACRALVRESTRKWQSEEDVIDDITCVVIYF